MSKEVVGRMAGIVIDCGDRRECFANLDDEKTMGKYGGYMHMHIYLW
jgi:hypothetical protein